MQWFLLFSLCLLQCSLPVTRFLLMPIQDQLINYYGINDVDYNLLQSLYSSPNAITSLLCGILIDKIGLTTMMCILWTTSMIGSAVMTISASSTLKSYTILCVGRILIGIGSESIIIGLKVVVVEYFDQKQHGLALGLLVSISSLALSFISMFIYKIYTLFNSIQIVLAIPMIMYPLLSFPLFLYVIFIKKNAKIDETQKLIITKNKDKNTNNFSISDIKQFSLTYWILISAACCYETCFGTFGNIKVSFLHNMYGYSYSLASTLPMVEGIIGVFLLPFFGYITDKFGMKCRLLIFSNIILCFAHYCFGWIHINIYFTIFTLVLSGISMSIFFGNIWPSIPVLVNANSTGTAYGFYNSSKFTAIAIGYIIVGLLTIEKDDGTKNFINVQYFEIMLTIISTVFLLVLLKMDSKNGYKLYYPISIRKRTRSMTMTMKNSKQTIGSTNELELSMPLNNQSR